MPSLSAGVAIVDRWPNTVKVTTEFIGVFEDAGLASAGVMAVTHVGRASSIVLKMFTVRTSNTLISSITGMAHFACAMASNGRVNADS